MRRVAYWIPAAVYAILIFTISHQQEPPGRELAPDYVAHFFEYGFFAVALTFGVTSGFRLPFSLRLALAVLGIASAYAVLDEFHQWFIPGRHASALDVVADVAGASAWGCLVWLVMRRRKRPES